MWRFLFSLVAPSFVLEQLWAVAVLNGVKLPTTYIVVIDQTIYPTSKDCPKRTPYHSKVVCPRRKVEWISRQAGQTMKDPDLTFSSQTIQAGKSVKAEKEGRSPIPYRPAQGCG